jgi:hypothetical protein
MIMNYPLGKISGMIFLINWGYKGLKTDFVLGDFKVYSLKDQQHVNRDRGYGRGHAGIERQEYKNNKGTAEDRRRRNLGLFCG